MAERALVLFAHGARDPAWAEPFQRLQRLVAAQLPQVAVGLAYLELMRPQLPELVEELMAEGCRDLTVVPVFLGQGGHVQRDLPLIIEHLREHHAELNVRVAAAAGEDAGVLAAIAGYCIGALQE